MAVFTFKGGIHPNDGKSLAKEELLEKSRKIMTYLGFVFVDISVRG